MDPLKGLSVTYTQIWTRASTYPQGTLGGSHYFCKDMCFPRNGFPGGSAVKNPLAMQETHETHVQFLGQEDPLEEGMVTHSSLLAWRIPWTEEPGGLQSMGS